MDMHRRTVMGLGLAGAGLAAAAGAGAGVEPAGTLVVEGDTGRFASAIQDIRAYAARHVAVYGLPGLTLSVAGPDGLMALMRFGYAQLETRTPFGADHLVQIGSISKSFTALCVFRLMEAGKLRLDADIATLLPGAPLPSGARITVQHLLNHSSGLPDDAPLFPRGGTGRLWRGFEPGAQWSYSNLGFLMLGTIVERLEGRPLAEVIHERVLRPLGMTATKGAILTGDRGLYAQGYSPLYNDRGYPRAGPLGPGSWTDVTQGAGCVASTGRDMALYCRWLIAAGQGRGAPLLSDAAAARFTKATIDAPGWAVRGAKYANGLAVVPVAGRQLLHHTGGMLAFNSALHVDPDGGVGAFASTNVGLAPYRPREITAFACQRLRSAAVGARFADPPPPAPPRTPPVVDYLGQYEGRQGERLEAAAGDDGLMVRIGTAAIAFQMGGEDAFIATDPTATPHPLVFRRAGKAVVRAWHAGREYVRVNAGVRAAAFSPPTPPALARLTGHYESDDPWSGSFRVTAQGADLFVDDQTPMTPLADGSFRVGDKDWSPERLWFDAPLDGRPTRANASGVDHLKRPAP